MTIDSKFKELDVVKLKDGSNVTIMEVYKGKNYLVEIDHTEDYFIFKDINENDIISLLYRVPDDNKFKMH